MLERPAALRMMGVGLILVCLFFGWLTWAFFSKAFTAYDDVKLVSKNSGLALPVRADVKLRGMIVGVVRDIRVENGRVVLTLGMNPSLIDKVPAGVRAEIVPKTLFGEKYVDLIPTAAGTGEHLRAGDTITDAKVPVEFEKFFNDIYPLLTAVPPEKVAYTLTALADSLKGRGNSLGATFEESNDYLKKFNPESQESVDDIVAFGQVANTYASEMDNFGELLHNSAKISRTIDDKESELGDFFKESRDLADVLRDFLKAAGHDIIATSASSVGSLEVGAEYSSMFPCWFKGDVALIDHVVNGVFLNNTLHIAAITVSPQPTRYGKPEDPQPEHPIVPTEARLESVDLAQPQIHGYRPNPQDPDNPYPAGLGTICDELYAAAKGHVRTNKVNPLPIPPELWKMSGLRNSHNGKFGTEADFNRAPASSSGIDSPGQREVLNRMTTVLTGVKTESVPDVASLLISPVVRGAAVSVK